MNKVFFSIVDGPNLVYGDWDPDRALPSDLQRLDLQTLSGPILDDVDFITDYSEPSPRGGHFRRYCALEDRLDAATLACLRDRVVRLLVHLARVQDRPAWVLYSNALDQSDEGEVIQHYTIRAYCDAAGVNGAMSLFEIEREDLPCFESRFGAFDRIAGLAAAEDGIGGVLGAQTLDGPWPSTRRHHRFSRPSTDALYSILEPQRSFFFEEYDNGTRLRLVSRSVSREELASSVAGFLD